MQFKTAVLALAALAAFGSAQASITTFTGETTASGPTYNRPIEDLSALSGVGTNAVYSTYTFSVDVSGTYTFLTTAEFDSFIFLYSPTFLPASSLTNAIVANDDLLGTTTSGFASDLTAGSSYTFVTTGFENSDFGKFSTTIGGPGTVAAVPEPETLALMALGLGVLGFARRYAAPKSA